jgi:hypothetical protein
MKTTDKIDAARIDMLLGNCACPGSNSSGPPWRRPPTRKAGRPLTSWDARKARLDDVLEDVRTKKLRAIRAWPLYRNRHQRPTSRAPGFPSILAAFADFGRRLDGYFHA